MIDGQNSARQIIRNNVHSSCTYFEDLYIYSLSNCTPWNAIGGKSGSTFLKTHDQRFILKEVSKRNLRHFLTFVCDYINYCERALSEKHPTAFVKVVGIYQISYKNTLNNRASSHYIFVMENLFYECNVSCIYDLKGSMRNRKIDINLINKNDELTELSVDEDTNNPGERNRLNHQNKNATSVLLDENLRQISIAYPLYVHEHSKIFLMEAIHRDSEFLKKHSVMDYSLLVGSDDENNEFIVGIIDYVSLYKFEKILESNLKKITNPIDPTVVHPSAYQKRFLDAINDYFTLVPDKWHPFIQLTPLAGKFLPDESAAGNNESDKEFLNTVKLA